MELIRPMEPYSTHLVSTVTAAVQSGILWPESPILELGCGHYSTPILSSIARAQKRTFQVIASEPNWAEVFQKDPHHMKIIKKEEWPDLDLTGEWGMVFVDHEEFVIHRFSQLFKLYQNTKIVVFHDANRIEEQGIDWGFIQTLYQYVYFCNRYSPSTAILSNFIDPRHWF